MGPLTRDALLNIFDRLSIPDLWRAKQVCKFWNSCIFQNLAQLLKAAGPWVLLTARNPGTSDVLMYYVWYVRSGFHYKITKGVNLATLGSVVASSGGLVCIQFDSESHVLHLVVGNPLTDDWRYLPPAPVTEATKEVPAWAYKFHLDVSLCHDSYKVLAIPETTSEMLANGIVEYDSKTQSWSVFPSVTPSTITMDPVKPCVCIWYNSHQLMPKSPLAPGGAETYYPWAMMNPEEFSYFGGPEPDDMDAEENPSFMYWSHSSVVETRDTLLWISPRKSRLQVIGFAVFRLHLSKVEMEKEDKVYNRVQESAWELISEVRIRDLYGPRWFRFCDWELHRNQFGGFDCTWIGSWLVITRCVKMAHNGFSMYCGRWRPIAFNLETLKWSSMEVNGFEKDLDFEGTCVFDPSPQAHP